MFHCSEFLNLAAKYINANRNAFPVDQNSKELYTLKMENNHNWVPDDAINIRKRKLEQTGVFSGGLYVHDFDRFGWTIHQALCRMRHGLLYKHWNINFIAEYLCVHKHNMLIPYKQYQWNLQTLSQHPWDEDIKLIEAAEGDTKADIHTVALRTIKMLKQRGLINRIHEEALKLQFLLKHTDNVNICKWAWYGEYEKFRNEGLPQVQHFTTQWMFYECSQLLCWNTHLITPCIHDLIDAPLFHFLLHEMKHNNGKHVIQSAWSQLHKNR